MGKYKGAWRTPPPEGEKTEKRKQKRWDGWQATSVVGGSQRVPGPAGDARKAGKCNHGKTGDEPKM